MDMFERFEAQLKATPRTIVIIIMLFLRQQVLNA